jgi:hypothetical protein
MWGNEYWLADATRWATNLYSLHGLDLSFFDHTRQTIEQIFALGIEHTLGPGAFIILFDYAIHRVLAKAFGILQQEGNLAPQYHLKELIVVAFEPVNRVRSHNDLQPSHTQRRDVFCLYQVMMVNHIIGQATLWTRER